MKDLLFIQEILDVIRTLCHVVMVECLLILTIISNSGNMRYNIINGTIRQGYSIYVDGDKNQYLKIKRDGTVTDLEFDFTLFKVV